MTPSPSAADAQFIRMTETPIPKLIGKLAVPTIVSMMITSIYNLADTFFVSKLGTSATGAVGVVFSLMAIIQAVGFMLGMGSGGFWDKSKTTRPMKWRLPPSLPPPFWALPSLCSAPSS